MKEIKRKNFNYKKLIPLTKKPNHSSLERKKVTIEYGKEYYQNVENEIIAQNDGAK